MITTVCILLAGLAHTTQTQVSRVPGPSSLEDQWAWASQQAANQGYEDVWIGYSIDRLMDENSWIGSFRSYSSGRDTTLLERITGRYVEYDEDLRSLARGVLDRMEGEEKNRNVIKEVAFLFRYDGNPSSLDNLITIRTTNVELAPDLENVPLLWLGKHDTQESVRYLMDMLEHTSVRKLEKKLTSAVGLHGPSDEVFSFLKTVVEGDHDEEVRKNAVFWMGQQASDEALEYLITLASSTEEQEIRERAVFSISQFEGENATDALIDLARNGEYQNVRKKAVFWLGQRASKKAVESLRDFVYSDENVDIQKQAVFALAQISDGGGVEEMIRIAKTHPHPKIRKQAIFWLGQSDDPRAFEAILAIVKGD